MAKLYFIYLRSRLDLVNDDDACYAASFLFGDRPEMIALDDDSYTFSNGFVSRVWSNQSAEGLASGWRAELSQFDAWAIHDGFDEVADSIGAGPTEAALRTIRQSLPATVPVTQAFLVFHEAEHDQDRATESVRRHWQGSAQSAFHFRDGRVLFVANQDPLSIMARRMEGVIPRHSRPGRPLRKDVQEIALYDGAENDGIAYYAGSAAWRTTAIYDEVDEDDLATGDLLD